MQRGDVEERGDEQERDNDIIFIFQVLQNVNSTSVDRGDVIVIWLTAPFMYLKSVGAFGDGTRWTC